MVYFDCCFLTTIVDNQSINNESIYQRISTIKSSIMIRECKVKLMILIEAGRLKVNFYTFHVFEFDNS